MNACEVLEFAEELCTWLFNRNTASGIICLVLLLFNSTENLSEVSVVFVDSQLEDVYILSFLFKNFFFARFIKGPTKYYSIRPYLGGILVLRVLSLTIN